MFESFRGWPELALDPMERISETLFALIMVLTFTCSFSVAGAGRKEVRELLIGALSWKKLELSTDGEFVLNTKEHSSSFLYSWMEFTYSPIKWWRAGLVTQRTKVYHTDLDIQRGVLIGFSHERTDFTTYIFNAGWTTPTVVLLLGHGFFYPRTILAFQLWSRQWDSISIVHHGLAPLEHPL